MPVNHLNIDIRKGKSPGIILFIHGNSGALNHFDSSFENDVLDQTLIRMDLPGHGDSYRSRDTSHYSFVNYRKVITDLANRHEEDILLVGHSMGGHLACEVAEEIPRLKGLIISGTPPLKQPVNMEEAFLPFPELQNMFTAEVPVETVTSMFTKACYHQSAVSTIVEGFYRADPQIRPKMLEDVSNGILRDEAQLFVRVPVKKFVIETSHDKSVNYDYVRSLPSNAKSHKIEDCGHYPSLESPTRWNEILRSIANEVWS